MFVHRAAVAALVAGAVACSEGVGPEAELLVQEQWEWVSACCSIAGQAVTPESEGVEYVLRFGRDGRVQAIRNDSMLVETGFRVQRLQPDDTADQYTWIEYDDPLPLVPGVEPARDHGVFVLEGGRLLLRNLASCADCFGDWEFLPRLE